MLNAGWHAHRLNAPGKFLVSAPEHGTPRRARGYLITDEAVSDTATIHAGNRPHLDEVSRRAIAEPTDPSAEISDNPQSGESPTEERSEGADAEDTLWLALCMAPEAGSDIAELLRLTGMSRPTLYRHLSQHAKSGRAVQVSRGHWRAAAFEEPSP